MSDDIRLSTGFFTHHKTIKLERRFGLIGVKSLITLWMWTAQNRPTGILEGMTEEDLEIASAWPDVDRKLIPALVELHWLDVFDGVYHVHGWAKNQPWIIGAGARKEKARKANAKRWGGDELMPQASSEDATRNPKVESEESPSPILSLPLQPNRLLEYTPDLPKEPGEAKQPKRTYLDHRPTACPVERWKKMYAYSWRFHRERSKTLGARAPFTQKKVLDGAKTLDNMTRVRQIESGQIMAAMDWAVTNEFWNEQVRALSSLTNISRNGDTKYANILTAMAKDLVRK